MKNRTEVITTFCKRPYSNCTLLMFRHTHFEAYCCCWSVYSYYFGRCYNLLPAVTCNFHSGEFTPIVCELKPFKTSLNSLNLWLEATLLYCKSVATAAHTHTLRTGLPPYICCVTLYQLRPSKLLTF